MAFEKKKEFEFRNRTNHLLSSSLIILEVHKLIIKTGKIVNFND